MIPGIDAGNSRFKYAVPDLTGNPKLITNKYGESFTPSAVFFSPEGSLIVGTDFNDRIAQKILEAFEAEHGFKPDKEKHPEVILEMMTRIEQLKISLSIQAQSPIVLFCQGEQLNMTVTQEMFNSWVKDIAEKTMKRTQKTIKEANLDMADIDEIYAVGGGSMMPIIIEQLESLTGKKVSKRCEPHCAAALGAVLAGRLEYQRQGKDYKCGDLVLPAPDWLVHDILSHSIGVLVLDENRNVVCSEILSKDTPIPSIQTKLFKLSEPNQTAVTIKILEGKNGQDAGKCLLLGHFDLTDLPPRPDMIGRIEVTFALDSNGLLTATARDNASGKTGEMQIDYEASSKNEVKGNAA